MAEQIVKKDVTQLSFDELIEEFELVVSILNNDSHINDKLYYSTVKDEIFRRYNLADDESSKI